jgi:hypothetical protein
MKFETLPHDLVTNELRGIRFIDADGIIWRKSTGMCAIIFDRSPALAWAS